MRALLFLAAALALGCDDSGVQSKVADVLAHGSVSAQAKCAFPVTQPGGGSFEAVYSAQKLVDGAAFLNLRVGGSVVVDLCERNETCATTYHVAWVATSGTIEASAAEGNVDFSWSRPGFTTFTFAADIDTYCNGFNLEAFGVE